MDKIKIVSKSGILPKYETKGAAGMDLRAYTSEKITLKPMERKLISTGIYVAIPEGLEAQIRARSGLAIKRGIGLVNGIGTIDSDYRGEIRIPLINWSQDDFTIENGDRIAQMVICSYKNADWEQVEKLDSTERDDGGFGHTGV